MRTKVLLFLTLGAAVLLSVLGNSSGAGFNQAEDRTGSPLSTGTCNICHDGGSFNPTLEVALLEGGQPVTTYKPGQAYELRVRILAGSGNPTGYGFQAVALAGTGNLNAGTFGTLPAGVRAVTLSNRRYVEQSRRLTANTVTIPWTAPATGTGPVRIFASGMAVNGNGSSSGDAVATLNTPLTLNENSSTALQGPQPLAAVVSAFPNPVQERLQVKIVAESTLIQLKATVFSLEGKIIAEQFIARPGTETQLEFIAADWAPGVYMIGLSDGKRVSALQVFKR